MAIVKTSIHIEEELYKRLKKLCVEYGQSLRNAIGEAIDEWLDKRGAK